MPFEDGLEMIIEAFKKKNEERMWAMYLMQYQHMTKESYVSFEEFYAPKTEQTVDENKSVDEILDEVESILKMKGMKKDGNI